MLLNHPTGIDEAFVRIHKWQMSVTGNVTASALLSLFEGYHAARIRADDSQGEHRGDISLLQSHTEQQFVDRLNGIASGKTIRNAIKQLQSMGFISIESNPDKSNPYDRTKYYLFHPEVAQKAINDYKASKANQALQTGNLPGRDGSQSGAMPLSTHENNLKLNQGLQTGNLPGRSGNQGANLPVQTQGNGLKLNQALQTGNLPGRDGRSYQVEMVDPTESAYLYRYIDINKKMALAIEEEDPEEEPTPLPPSRDLAAEAAALKSREQAMWSKDKQQRSGQGWLYPWNENKNPRDINGEFVKWLVDRQVPWIHFNFTQSTRLTEEIVIAHCRKLAFPDKREKYEPDLIEAWGQFVRERDARAARIEADRLRNHNNHPDRNVRYKRFSKDLEKLSGFRVESIADFDYTHGLRIKIFHDSQQWEFFKGKFDHNVPRNLYNFWVRLQRPSDRMSFEQFVAWFDCPVFAEWEQEQKALHAEICRRYREEQDRKGAA